MGILLDSFKIIHYRSKKPLENLVVFFGSNSSYIQLKLIIQEHSNTIKQILHTHWDLDYLPCHLLVLSL